MKRSVGFLLAILAVVCGTWLAARWAEQPATLPSGVSSPQPAAEADGPIAEAKRGTLLEPAVVAIERASEPAGTPSVQPQPSLMWVRIVDRSTGAPMLRAWVVRPRDVCGSVEERPEGYYLIHCGMEKSEPSFLKPWKPRDGVCRVQVRGYSSIEFTEEPGHERMELAREFALDPCPTLTVQLFGVVVEPKFPFHVRVDVSDEDLAGLASTATQFVPRGLTYEQWCDANGKIDFDQNSMLPSGVPLRLSLEEHGLFARSLGPPITLAPSEARHIDVDLAPRCRVTGRILDQRRASIPNQRLRLTALTRGTLKEGNRQEIVADAASDADGVFDLGLLAAGHYSLQDASNGSSNAFTDDCVLTKQLFEIGPEESTHRVELLAHCGLTIRGRVLGVQPSLLDRGQGGGVAYARAEAVDGSHTAGAIVEPDGTFELRPLLAGAYDVYARVLDPMFAGEQDKQPEHSRSIMVRVQAGEAGVVLSMQRNLQRLAVRVVDESGERGVSAWVMLTRLGSPDEFFPETVPHGFSGDDGICDFEDLLPGRYQSIANDGRSLAGMSEVFEIPRTSSDPVQVGLRPAARIRFVIKAPVAKGRLTVTREGVFAWRAFDACTSWQMGCVVPPGNLRLRLCTEASGAPIERSLTLEPGEQRDVVFDRAR